MRTTVIVSLVRHAALLLTVVLLSITSSSWITAAVVKNRNHQHAHQNDGHGRPKFTRRQLQSISSSQSQLQLQQQPSPFTILSLGGSVTWGAGLSDRELSFSSLLQKQPLVQRCDNLAIRATSAVWASTCLQTMVSGVPLPPVEYDIVLLEFSLNGMMGLSLLLKRLRRRYPTALIIYIDLYSNRRPGYSNCIGGKCRTTAARRQGLVELLDTVGARFLELPRPTDPLNWKKDVAYLFANDDHHLSALGHEWVANRVMDWSQAHISSQHAPPHSNESGSWLEGDLCFSWFHTGATQPGVTVHGANLVEFSKFKWAYEVELHAILDFESPLTGSAPLIMVYMTKQDKYPRMEVTLNSQPPVTLDSKSSKRWADDHVTATHSLGIVHPKESIHLEIVKDDPKKESLPFRLVGLVMCAACRFFDPHFDEKDCRQRQCVDFVDDEQ